MVEYSFKVRSSFESGFAFVACNMRASFLDFSPCRPEATSAHISSSIKVLLLTQVVFSKSDVAISFLFVTASAFLLLCHGCLNVSLGLNQHACQS